MTEIIGRQIEVGVGIEEVRGTPVAPDKWIKKLTANFSDRANKIIDESNENSLADASGARVVQKWSEGELSGNIHADVLGYFLYNLYGAVTESVVEAGVYQHIFTLLQSTKHPALSITLKDGAVEQKVFPNCIIDTFELNFGVDTFLTMTANIKGKTGSVSTETVSYETEYDFIGKDVTVKVATSEAGLTSATALPVKEMTLTWNTNMLENFVLGDYSPEDLYNAAMSIEGEIELLYGDTTFKDLFTTDAYRYMQITVTGSQTIGAVSNPGFTILLNKVAITDWSREDAQNELVTQPISFKALQNTTDSQQSKITLKNVTETYDLNIS